MNIAVKILAFLITAIVLIPVSYVCFVFMLVAMNGYNNADYALPTFWVWAALTWLVSGLLAVLTTHLFEAKKGLNIFASAAISIIVFVFLGAISSAIGVVLGIAAQELARNF